METAKAEKRNREVEETYCNWLQVKMDAQEIAKTCTSYRRLLVVSGARDPSRTAVLRVPALRPALPWPGGGGPCDTPGRHRPT